MPRRSPIHPIYALRRGAGESSASLLSIETVVGLAETPIERSLEHLCTFIDDHRSMRGAEIVNSRTYVERKIIAPHRCVVLELHKEGRKNIWLRLERKPTTRAALVLGMGKTPANDVVNMTRIVSGRM